MHNKGIFDGLIYEVSLLTTAFATFVNEMGNQNKVLKNKYFEYDFEH